MAASRYRAGIIGLGFIGGADQVSGDALGQKVENLDGTHLDALTGHPRIELVAGSSRDEGRRERFARRTGAAAYARWEEMLAKERLDIVSVATYAPFHAEITCACAAHGARVVYCEKPIATRLSDAERMVRACDDAGALLVVNHQRRFHSNYRRLQELIASGGLGDLTSVNLQWGNGRLGNVGTHMIDALCMLTGRRVEAVSATLDLSGKPDCRGAEFCDPGGWGVMRMAGGLMATMDAADFATVPARIVINGRQGRAVTGGHDVALEYWDGRKEHWPAPDRKPSSMDRAAAEMVAWLDKGGPFPYPARENVPVLEAVVACHVSHGRGAAWTDLPLAGEDRDVTVRSG